MVMVEDIVVVFGYELVVDMMVSGLEFFFIVGLVFKDWYLLMKEIGCGG